ncbi:hypothetical protein CGCSCA4_v000851 [Colletotrichum siamense]|uniref:Uncharacterized protein n=1 Tax=Colletotrichum siamense TaxID=690259 RepID=A0A9P5F551_COLSI|nr:hypothetical protein CGCSCA4_v000851 [Colletotrichum siamense]KAF4866218.1 hypothetical protein CGCSCA2_v000954 [Colletotrichum siamense]
MAPLAPAALLHSLFRRDDDAGVGSSCDGVNGSCIEVVCAWPLSGQYGFGQRILYYILVVVCVVARKEEWIRAVCQAAALLVPAVAAIHGIVLASMHVDGATDMDIYGALQFCSIGILAAPVTVKLSSTFFYDPGRNIIFLWTGLILSGLLSLAVEFYRSNTHPCATGNSLIPSLRNFPYGEEDLCGLVCSEDRGPFSSLRQGATSEIYVVPKPATLPFGMAMFLAAAECVPAILSLVSMWNKILEINWKRGKGSPDKERIEDQGIIPGTNGATLKGMKDVNQAIRSLLSAVEVPVFGGAWLAVLIIGEINFWSPQVNYHTEPISNIGQWGTILGTGMAGLGSLYVWLADSNGDLANPTTTHCNCPHYHGREPPDGVLNGEVSPRASTAHREFQERTGSEAGLSIATSTAPSTGEWVPRRKIANALGKIGNYFGNPAKDPFGAGDYKTGEWPRIPGEAHRNSQMAEHDDRYSIMEGPSSSRDSADGSSSSDSVSGAPMPASPTSPTSPTSVAASSFSSFFIRSSETNSAISRSKRSLAVASRNTRGAAVGSSSILNFRYL